MFRIGRFGKDRTMALERKGRRPALLRCGDGDAGDVRAADSPAPIAPRFSFRAGPIRPFARPFAANATIDAERPLGRPPPGSPQTPRGAFRSLTGLGSTGKPPEAAPGPALGPRDRRTGRRIDIASLIG
jgi:hypothetical protein